MNRTLETPRSFLSESTPEFVVISPELVELNITEIMHMTELLVMGVIVELRSGQSPGIVGNRPNLLVRTMNGENTSDDIVRGVCLYDDGSIWNPMGEDRSRGEGVFEVLEGRATGVTEVPGNTFVGEAGQRSDDTGVIIYETPVKIHKAEEGLHILDLPRLGPVLYGLYLPWRHSKSGGDSW